MVYEWTNFKWVQVDKVAFDAIHDGAEVHIQNLEPWFQVQILWAYNLKHLVVFNFPIMVSLLFIFKSADN